MKLHPGMFRLALYNYMGSWLFPRLSERAKCLYLYYSRMTAYYRLLCKLPVILRSLPHHILPGPSCVQDLERWITARPSPLSLTLYHVSSSLILKPKLINCAFGSVYPSVCKTCQCADLVGIHRRSKYHYGKGKSSIKHTNTRTHHARITSVLCSYAVASSRISASTSRRQLDR